MDDAVTWGDALGVIGAASIWHCAGSISSAIACYFLGFSLSDPLASGPPRTFGDAGWGGAMLFLINALVSVAIAPKFALGCRCRHRVGSDLHD